VQEPLTQRLYRQASSSSKSGLVATETPKESDDAKGYVAYQINHNPNYVECDNEDHLKHPSGHNHRDSDHVENFFLFASPEHGQPPFVKSWKRSVRGGTIATPGELDRSTRGLPQGLQEPEVLDAPESRWPK